MTAPHHTTRAAGVLVVGWAWTTLTWAATFGTVLPPLGAVPWWITIASWTALAFWLRAEWRKAPVRQVTARLSQSVILACCVSTAALNALWDPPLLWLLVWITVAAVGVVAAVIAFVRARRRRADAAISLLLLALLALISGPWMRPLADFGVELRTRMVASAYVDDADRLLGPAPGPLFPEGDRLVGTASDGEPVVAAWIWNRGLAVGPSSGVAYDPHGALAADDPSTDIAFTYFGPYWCDHLFDDWWHCTFS